MTQSTLSLHTPRMCILSESVRHLVDDVLLCVLLFVF